MAIQEIAQTFNPITGVFGTGNVQFFSSSGTWTVPPGIGKVRARMWGGGGYNRGSGGGFSLKAIYDLTSVTSIAVTVGAGGNATTSTGGTSSFGSYCSATGGVSNGAVGAGSGGDINYSGGLGDAASIAGGGVASLFGNGGAAATALSINGGNGASGGGAGSPATSNFSSGGNGFLGVGGFYNNSTSAGNYPPSTGLLPVYSIDFIGTGGGGTNAYPGVNGGGGGGAGSSGAGGFPGGGGGGTAPGGNGLVIVEW
jgi:hypothetical protein